jgi:adenine-specific DNA glycosylase
MDLGATICHISKPNCGYLSFDKKIVKAPSKLKPKKKQKNKTQPKK